MARGRDQAVEVEAGEGGTIGGCRLGEDEGVLALICDQRVFIRSLKMSLLKCTFVLVLENPILW